MADIEVAEAERGISRRQMLRRGAVAGTALVWSVPVIQAISMTPAHADTTSAPAKPPTQRTGGSQVAGESVTAANPAPNASSGPLASTGAAVGTATAVGVGAVLAGAGLVAAAMRNRTDDDEAPAAE